MYMLCKTDILLAVGIAFIRRDSQIGDKDDDEVLSAAPGATGLCERATTVGLQGDDWIERQPEAREGFMCKPKHLENVLCSFHHASPRTYLSPF
jgi:hypothetical protein